MPLSLVISNLIQTVMMGAPRRLHASRGTTPRGSPVGQYEIIRRVLEGYRGDVVVIIARRGAALPAPLAYLRQFESIGGLGFSQVFAVGREQTGMRRVRQARRIIGVLYNV